MPPRKSSPQKQIGAHSVDLFDDDDDDLLRTIAEQVESQFGKKNSLSIPLLWFVLIFLFCNFIVSGTCGGILDEGADDDGFFQPDVLEYISQIECNSIYNSLVQLKSGIYTFFFVFCREQRKQLKGSLRKNRLLSYWKKRGKLLFGNVQNAWWAVVKIKEE